MRERVMSLSLCSVEVLLRYPSRGLKNAIGIFIQSPDVSEVWTEEIN